MQIDFAKIIKGVKDIYLTGGVFFMGDTSG